MFGLLKGLIKAGTAVTPKALGLISKPGVTKLVMHNVKQQAIYGTLFGVGAGILAKQSPHEIVKNTAVNIGIGALTLGVNSPWRQMGYATLISMAPSFGGIARGLVSGYRGVLESRTSVAIPFSHSTLAMDQAFAAMQYSKQRMSDAYQHVGNEAAFFSARFLQR